MWLNFKYHSFNETPAKNPADQDDKQKLPPINWFEH
jgi:hypothetical protein